MRKRQKRRELTPWQNAVIAAIAMGGLRRKPHSIREREVWLSVGVWDMPKTHEWCGWELGGKDVTFTVHALIKRDVVDIDIETKELSIRQAVL